jgi:hypothetical protein
MYPSRVCRKFYLFQSTLHVLEDSLVQLQCFIRFSKSKSIIFRNLYFETKESDVLRMHFPIITK